MKSDFFFNNFNVTMAIRQKNPLSGWPLNKMKSFLSLIENHKKNLKTKN
jgi:hypothetical protein